MSDHSHEGGVCETCRVRNMITKTFGELCPEGKIGDWVDGIIDAAAQIAAVHVVPAHEGDERKLLTDRLGRRFDYFLRIETEAAAAEATKQ